MKRLAYETAPHHLRRSEQRAAEYLALNPQGLVPALVLDGGEILTQSLAICEYLDTTYPEPPLLPANPVQRARVRAFAQVIACDIHPVQNLKILNRLRDLKIDDTAVNDWARAVIAEGLDACESLLAAGPSGEFCFGGRPGLADVCLIPQLGNARRFGLELRWPRLLQIESTCNSISAFRDSAPEYQPDAE